MQSIYVFINITKIADFSQKSGDVSKTHGVCHVIYTFSGYFLGKVQQC